MLAEIEQIPEFYRNPDQHKTSEQAKFRRKAVTDKRRTAKQIKDKNRYCGK